MGKLRLFGVLFVLGVFASCSSGGGTVVTEVEGISFERPTPTPEPTPTPLPTATPVPAPTPTPGPIVLPTVLIDAPEARSILDGGDIQFAGTASDDMGISEVEIAIRDRDNGVWLRRDGSFGTRQFFEADLAEPGAATTSWSLPIALIPGSWSVTVRAEDNDGNRTEESPTAPFEIRVPSDDATAPVATIDSPDLDAVVLVGEVTITGTATDNVGVGLVEVGFRDRETDLWLRRDGTLGARQYIEAQLAQPGATSTTWSLPVSLTTGNWALTVRAEDLNLNREEDPTTSRIEVRESIDDDDNEAAPVPEATPSTQTSLTADVIAPNGTLLVPAEGGVFNGSQVVISGSAFDNIGVATVQVAIRDRDNKVWLRSDGSFGDRQYLDAEVVSVGETSVTWTFPTTLPGGNWSVIVRTEDANGNRDDTPPTVSFTVRT